MKEKGFTLIELLAVIVILAIIALIATPIILGIINDAKNESAQRSAELYLKGAELAIARKNLTTEFGGATCSVLSATGNLSCEGITGEIIVEMDGEKPTSGTIVFSNGKITSVTNLQTSGKTFETNSNGKLVIAGSSSSNTDNAPSEQGENTENTGSEETNAQTMYYTDDLSGTINETAAPAQPSTTPPEGKNVYIGYYISNGVVSEAYVCFKRNSDEYCLRGNGDGAYSDNQDVLREAFADVVSTCRFRGISSSCNVDGFSVTLSDSPYANANDGDVSCTVSNGSFNCQ